MQLDPKNIVEELRNNLERYPFRDGFTVFRELLQNADDAEAAEVILRFSTGWENATNPLLRGPGILLVNDGKFDQTSAEAMNRLGSSPKATDQDAVGRYGLGQKSVFHICDAFIVAGHQYETGVAPFVVNPFQNTGKAGDACLSWNELPDSDTALLTHAVDRPVHAKSRLFMWFPLRREGLRPKPKSLGVVAADFQPGKLAALADKWKLAELMAALRHVRRIEVDVVGVAPVVVDRADAQRMIGYRLQTSSGHAFGGTLNGRIASVGREFMGESGFRNELRRSDNWPRTRNLETDEEERQKALPHAAVVLVADPTSEGELAIDWSVLLPVAAALQRQPLDARGRVKILLHGYFFVDSGRKSVAGFDAEEAVESAEKSTRTAWNQALRDELVLPMLPAVLHDGMQQGVLTSDCMTATIAAISRSTFGRDNRHAIAARTSLARVISASPSGSVRADWQLVPASTNLRPLPAPDETGKIAVARLFPDLLTWASAQELVLIGGPEAALLPSVPIWRDDELASLLESMSPTVFNSKAQLEALAEFLVRAGAITQTSPAIAKTVLSHLRTAFGSDRPLAPHDAIKAVLDRLNCLSVVTLSVPPDDRFIWRALASATDAPLCLPAEWLEGRQCPAQLSTTDAYPLLQALQPLLEGSTRADAAGTAAAAIIRKLASLRDAVDDDCLRDMPLLRAFDGQQSTLLSLKTLYDAGRAGQLSRDTPPARKLAGALKAAVPDTNTWLIATRTAEILQADNRVFSVADLNQDKVLDLVAPANTFGPAQARAVLLGQIFSDLTQHHAGLRALAAGDRRASRDAAWLVSLPTSAKVLDPLVRNILGTSGAELLVEPEVLNYLPRKDAEHLGITTLDGVALGKLLVRHAAHLIEAGLDAETARAILASDVTDADIEKLPVFASTTGVWHYPSTLWRITPDWLVPTSLQKLVPIAAKLANPNAAERANRLIHAWSPEAQVNFCLSSTAPSHHASEILSALGQIKGDAPASTRSVKWLPGSTGTPWAPDDVLDLPTEVLTAARQVLGAGGGAFLPVDELAVDLRQHPSFNALRQHALLPDRENSLAALMLRIEEAKPVAFLGNGSPELASALQTLAKAGAELPTAGWALMKALLVIGQPPIDLLAAFGQLPTEAAEAATVWLQALSGLAQDHTSKASAETTAQARIAFDHAFPVICSWAPEKLIAIVSRISVPVMDGTWRTASEVVAHTDGIAPAHRLHSGLERHWPSTDRSTRSAGSGLLPPKPKMGTPSTFSSAAMEQTCAESLRSILESIVIHLPGEAIALLVGVIRRTKAFRDLVLDFGLSEVDLERVWARLREAVDPLFEAQLRQVNRLNQRNRTLLEFHVSRATKIPVWTLTNTMVSLPTGASEPLMIIGNGHEVRKAVGFEGGEDYWHRNITVSAIEMPVEAAHVRRLLCTIAKECLGYGEQPLSALDGIVEECLRVDQATVADTRALLQDGLPYVLAELKPNHGTLLNSALSQYRNAVQFLTDEKRNQTLSKEKQKLWQQVLVEPYSTQMLETVRSAIGRYGYGPARVAFELLQNADDASSQHKPPFDPACRFEFDEEQWRVLHWGRLINQLGANAKEGERQGWRHDLYNMLLMNLSEKQEEVTGRFGLGFKSVHLVAKHVRIASGFVACEIKGGMLPELWPDGPARSFEASREGRRATVIELDLEEKLSAPIAEANLEFKRAARWLPAMTRCIREINVDARRYVARYDDTGADGSQHLTFSGSEPGHALALKIDDQTTLIIPLDQDGPVAAPTGLSRLWLLAPLEEECSAGWLLNSFGFRVDPGRGRLAGAKEERADVFRRFGRALGDRLVALFDLIHQDWPQFAAKAGLANLDPESGPGMFIKGLVRLFALDLNDNLACHMHEVGGGLHRLFDQRPAVPTGLPTPFAAFLQAGSVRWQLKSTLADEYDRLRQIHDWNALDDIQNAAVGSDASQLLAKLGFGAPRPFGLSELLRLELGSDKQVNAAKAARLGRVFCDDLVKGLDGSARDDLLDAAASAKFPMVDGTWSEARLPPRNMADPDEELGLILAFAPDMALVDPYFTASALDFYRLAMRQSGFQRTADSFVGWARSMSDLSHRAALLQYVVNGGQGRKLGNLLSKNKPSWLPGSPDDLRASELIQGLDAGDVGWLITLLFPSVLAGIGLGEHTELQQQELEPTPTSTPADELMAIYKWWKSNHRVARQDYNEKIWPAGFSPLALADDADEENRVGWFTFFGLGLFRTIGWNNESAHCNFINEALRKGWWQQMAEARLPHDPQPWLRQLEDMATPEAWRIQKPQWRRAMADLYVLARWLPDYADAFTQLPKVIAKYGRIKLSDAWRLSSSPIWHGRGLEGAPLSQSLGMGANWMIREAIRQGFWSGEEARQMRPYAWSATAGVRRILGNVLEAASGPGGSMDVSPSVFEYVEEQLGDDAEFLGDFDLPLQLWSDGGRSRSSVAIDEHPDTDDEDDA